MISQREIPRVIWIHTLLIIAIGLAALYSASFNNARAGQAVFYDQLWCALAAIVIMGALSHTDYRRFFEVSYAAYAVSVVFLVLVFVLGREALGATRWFSIGSFSFQPSEFSKLAVILMLARYFSQRRPRLSFDVTSILRRAVDYFLVPLMLTGISIFLIFKQPDLGTAILIFGIFLVMLFMSGLSFKMFAAFIAAVLAVVPFVWHVLKAYQRDRLLVFIDPSHDPTGAGYTIIQSKIAVGSGQLLGKGWLAGTQNQLNFLPERHTDFIFSVIGEEWGLAGAMFTVYCYAALIYCGFLIAGHHKDRFGQMVTVGIVSILAMQVVINIGMVVGLFPVVGITLPLVSYGRTSFVVFAVMLGFLLNLSKRRTMF
ncbi:MAG: rod shape-determining protein RodA [Candidatus Omnitrophota bacterium]|nr:rod shape-determining protein RodA [Candidatus Omnitrophota bacterium]